ncbi:glycosyltransferase [Xylanimonas ulmi]|uniref:Putative rhamnosyltransferase n=1 Tax=Xylanimonas ulmi TaxID=228973 RepID=A0A4Q7M4B5_9MICO|nr:glycosyltransferase [Xylanibacterium ulmi]RZS61853.1 putative rhamnosyltransferase [Xylanibacterium ulmi]
MSQSLGHVIVTRFNLPSPGAESFIRAKEGWLRNRVELFETYCLPSMRAQTDRDFTWIVYIDPASPPWFMEWVERTAPGAFTALRREAVGPAEMVADIAAVLGSPPDHLLTTNLDNDDAVAVDFVARLRAAGASQTGRAALYLENGLILQGAQLFARRDRSNAFCSVVEPWQGAMTCWADWHNRLDVHMPAVRVSGAPGWLQVVHRTNVSNRVRGRLVSPRPYGRLFVVAIDDLPEPTTGDRLTDRLIRAPRRVLRDASRRVVKLLVLWIGGPDSVIRLTDARATVTQAVRRRLSVFAPVERRLPRADR